MKITNEIYLRNAFEKGEAKVLTTEIASALKGKKIATLYFGYGGQDGYKEFIVGDIISEYDMASKEKMNDGRTRAEYWQSFMKERRLNEVKSTLCLLDVNGKNTYIKAYEFNNGDFTCSDSDRFVMFAEIQD